jgi:Chaperone of endosialidase
VSGGQNVAVGYEALINSTGDNNIAVGYQGGFNLTIGSNNIDIGSVGVAGESDVIRIGTKGTHKITVIAGINSSKVTGSVVYVTPTGRLGVLASSERFKTAIEPIGDRTGKLQMLRPVSFHLKADPKGVVQYGLIAEEVAKVYPELVIRDEKGRIDGVRYDELAPMLLNEMQKKNAAQDAELRDLKRQVAVMSAALEKLQEKNQLVAQR